MSQLARTTDKITAGIVNVPLTKPATLYFTTTIKDVDKFNDIMNIYKKYQIPFSYIIKNNRRYITSINEVGSYTIKQIFHNFRSLKPKIISQWRYLFWENDNHDIQDLQFVLSIYSTLDLPLYFHKSMRGYHFISVKPISLQTWKDQIPKLRHLNVSYPPVTLRLKANKYQNELDVFREGYLHLPNSHSDTVELKNLVDNQNIAKITEKYLVVWYPFDNNHKDDNDMNQELMT